MDTGAEQARVVVLTRQPDSYSCRRFSAAARRLGINLELTDPHTLQLQLDHGAISATDAAGRDYAGVRVVPRLSGLASEYALAALRQLELSGARTLNSHASLLRLRFKYSALGELATAGIAVPDTAMLRADGGADVAAAVARLGGYPLVLKFLRGSQGVGVVFAPDESVVQSVLEALNQVQYDVMLQRLYPAAAESDLRVLVLRGKVLHAIRRRSQAGRFRSNFHRGGTAEPADPTAEQAALAVRAAELFGLGFAGVDLIDGGDGRDLVLEVNGSPGFEAVDQACGVDVAEDVLKALCADTV
jgi:ribosomal protein S6--L-glutamate ligase